MFVKFLFCAGSNLCTFGLKVHSEDGLSTTSNIAVAPLQTPTFAADDDKDDDQGLGGKEIAEIVFGTIGALAPIATAGLFIYNKLRGKSEQTENNSGM